MPRNTPKAEDEITGGAIGVDASGLAALDVGAIDSATGAFLFAEYNTCLGCDTNNPNTWLITEPLIQTNVGAPFVGGFVYGRVTGSVIPEPRAGLVFALGAWMIATVFDSRRRRIAGGARGTV